MLKPRSLGFAALALFTFGCSGRGGSELPGSDGAGARGNVDTAGGTTSDFTGDLELCETERQEAPGDEPALGFSVTELLAASAGQFDVPLRWQSRCQTSEVAHAACGAGFEALHDQETTVRMTVEPLGPARVRYPIEGQLCAQSMSVPIRLKLESTDGVLAAELPAQLGSECGDQVGVGFLRALGEVQGTLSDASQGFPEGSQVEFTAGFFGDRMWFDLYVITAERDALFSIAMPPYGQGWIHDVPRTQVELEPGTPLAGSRCPSTGGVTY